MSEGTSPQVGPAAAGTGSPWAPSRGPEPTPADGAVSSGATSVLPPQSPPHPPPGPAPEPTPKGVWLLSGAAVILSVAAVVMGTLAWTRPDPAPVTTTVSPQAPVYSDAEIAAARDDACAAADSVVAAIYETSVPLVATLPDVDSPEYKAALANEQAVVLVELEYLRLHITPATPPEIADPLNDYIDAVLAIVAADTSNQDRNPPTAAGQTAMDKAHAACKR